jgi:hypothetical protein
MASERQIEANRKNAKQSTGPSTAPGKARSRRNALRHGLSIASDGTGLEALARTIMAGIEPEAVASETIRLARTKLELARIRAVRQGLLIALLQSPDPKWAKRLRALERYERAAFANQKRIIRACKR